MSDKETIRQYVVDTLLSGDGRGLTDDLDLEDSGILDSFGKVELLSFLESKLGVTIEAADVGPDSFRSIESIARMVAQAKAR